MKFTPEQEAAVLARNHTVLVSAAAGSGKTAVLVERIVSLIREGNSISEMLICTFTRAAAAEMRERLGRRLREELPQDPERFGNALDELESADISTIHSFCQRLMRDEFQLAGIDPMFRIAEDHEKARLLDESMKETLNFLLGEEKDPNVIFLMDAVDQKTVQENAKELYNYVLSMEDPIDWLARKAETGTAGPCETTGWFDAISRVVKLKLRGLPAYADELERTLRDPLADPRLQADVDAVRDECMRTVQLLEQQGPEAALQAFDLPRMITLRGLEPAVKEWKDKVYADVRKKIKDMVDDLKKMLLFDREALKAELELAQPQLLAYARIIAETDRRFSEKKKEKGLADFADLEQNALTLLRDPECAARTQAKFRHIFVDECQDLSAIQNAILEGLHGEDCSMFLVGDIKQSIYRFRQADPTLFLEKLQRFSDDPDARDRRIFLQKNFRSLPEILDAGNRVFRTLFNHEVTEIDYAPQDELIPGSTGASRGPAVEVNLLRLENDAGQPTIRAEAVACMAERMQELMRTTRVDEKGNEVAWHWRDMAVLMRSVSGRGDLVEETLRAAGIPCYLDVGGGYFELPEILAITSILRVADQPLQDMPLISALTLQPLGFSEEELAQIRIRFHDHKKPFWQALLAAADGEDDFAKKCRAAIDTVNEWHFLSQVMPLSEFVHEMINRTGLYILGGALPDGDARRKNLMLLRTKAEAYEAEGAGTLHGFIETIDSMRESDDTAEATALSEGDDLVHIMTMHKSKGLQFPAVFLLNTDDQLGKNGSVSSYAIHSKLGFTVPAVDRSRHSRCKHAMLDGIRQQISLDERSEAARLLYVAMTRPQEKLFLFAACTPKRAARWLREAGPARILEADSMSEWMLAAIQDDCSFDLADVSSDTAIEGTPWFIRPWQNAEERKTVQQKHLRDISRWILDTVSVPASEETVRRMTRPETIVSRPLKTSVTAIVRRRRELSALPDTKTEEDQEDKSRELTGAGAMKLNDLPARPRFLEERAATPTEAGTLTHRCLAAVRLENLHPDTLAADLSAELARLKERNIITPAESEALRPNLLLNFFRSDLGRRLLASTVRHREWHFTEDRRGSDESLMQGVIDCCFLDGDEWVLVDYKTDRDSSAAELTDRYGEQLALYAEAMEHITGRRVREKWLFALRTGEAIPV